VKTAFVIGNGTSRKDISIPDLKKSGSIYGCNALYREFTPDHLIAVDTKMIKEIVEAKYHLTNSVWSNPNSYTKSIEKLCLFSPNLGWSSGPSALHLASNHKFQLIYILGFDYVGLGNQGELVNNMYAGTKNYKDIKDRATYYGNWLRQTATIIQRNKEIKYIRVIEHSSSFIPDQLRKLHNITHITVEDFKKKLNC
jgi:hypothetical protein